MMGSQTALFHPRLLEDLAREFVRGKYDVKSLIKWICNSEAYNLSHVAANPEMAKPENDVHFARMRPHALEGDEPRGALQIACGGDPIGNTHRKSRLVDQA